MSEQAPTPTPTPEQIDADAAFDPIARQAQAQMDIYAENRPYQDEAGVHDPATGEVVNPGEYFNEQHQTAKDEAQTPYEDMSMSSLAHKLGEAEYNQDQTTQDSVTEVLLDKMGAEEARIASQGGSENQARQDNLWDSVMAAKDLKYRQLQKKNGEIVDDNAAGTGNDGAEAAFDVEPDIGEPQEVPENNGETDENGGEAANPGGNERLHKIHANPDQVMWGPDENGQGQRGLEFRHRKLHRQRVGNHLVMQEETINWDHPYMNGPNKQVIMRAFDREANTHYTGYIKGNVLYEIVSENGSKPTITARELDEDVQMPDMAIGRKLAGNLELWQVEAKAPGEKVPYSDKRFDKTHKRRGEDPFTKLDRMIGEGGDEIKPDGTDYEPDWVFHNGGDQEPPTEELPVENGGQEAGGSTGNPLERMAEFSARFEDKTYVPTLEEYAQMREAAGHIHIDYGDEEGKSPIRYLDDNGQQLNATQTRNFLDKVNPGKWMLKDREAEVADDMYEHATPINIDRLDLPQRTRRDWLSYRQFTQERSPADGEPEPSREQLVEQYKEYIGRRVELSDSFTHRQTAHEEYGDQIPEVITPGDVAVGALRDFRRNLQSERLGRRAKLSNARPDRLARRAARRIRRGKS